MQTLDFEKNQNFELLFFFCLHDCLLYCHYEHIGHNVYTATGLKYDQDLCLKNLVMCKRNQFIMIISNKKSWPKQISGSILAVFHISSSGLK